MNRCHTVRSRADLPARSSTADLAARDVPPISLAPGSR